MDLINTDTHHVSKYMNSLEKRALDILVMSSIGAVALTAGALTAATITLRERINPFFKQERVGLDGELFSVIKLRTMKKDGELVAYGGHIRAAGLDETPQFINIALGQMSVVGYRPILTEDLNYAVGRLRPHFVTSSPYHPNHWMELRE